MTATLTDENRSDAFEKRLAAYRAVLYVIDQVGANGTVTDADVVAYRDGVKTAEALLGHELLAYLNEEFAIKLEKHRQLDIDLDEHKKKDRDLHLDDVKNERARIVNDRFELTKWLRGQERKAYDLFETHFPQGELELIVPRPLNPVMR